ncbi:MAG: hypothetical protein M0Z66_01495 [Thermaerobacter sp.]|nr:hypothetical protein [Thermaerobacter sp.]
MEHPAIVFTSRVDATNPESVAAFVWWLFWGSWPDDHGSRMDAEAITSEYGKRMQDADYALERFWGENAPRFQMAHLCWQACNPGRDKNQFTVVPDALLEDLEGCGPALGPIQERVVEVLRALEQRKRDDLMIGQGAAGESFWLPPKEAAYLDAQLQRVSYRLIEQPSIFEKDLEEAISTYLITQVQAVHVPSADSARAYAGRHVYDDGVYIGCFVQVETSGSQWPLVNARDPMSRSLDFTWGYPGTGPTNLAISLLTDVAGGDLTLAQEYSRSFLKEVVMAWDQQKPIHITRIEIVNWLSAHGVDQELLARRAKAAERRLNDAHPRLAPLLSRLDRARSRGHLRAQRLDHVAEDFEAALAVDLADLLKKNGAALICNHCRLPVTVDNSVRSARQMGRWRSGQPIYHEWCAEMRARERKMRYRERRVATDPLFLERERQRARKRRMAK